MGVRVAGCERTVNLPERDLGGRYALDGVKDGFEAAGDQLESVFILALHSRQNFDCFGRGLLVGCELFP